MTLIEEIQQEAVDSKGDLGAILRKCKILAARLGSRRLEDWLLWESNGYPENVGVPEYRSWPLELKGHFYGPSGSGMRNAPIPWICLPKDIRESYQNYKCRQSIASIEDILMKSKAGYVQVRSGDLAVVLGTNVYQHQNCMQAWAEFSVSNLVELLNAVRNKVLDFAIAVWKEYPAAGELSEPAGQSIQPERINHIFNTTVYGGAATFIGRADNSPMSFTISHGDFTSLEQILRLNGIQDEDILELKDAVRDDNHPETVNAFGPRVSNWIARMIEKAAQGIWNIGISTAGKLLSEAITKYYGL